MKLPKRERKMLKVLHEKPFQAVFNFVARAMLTQDRKQFTERSVKPKKQKPIKHKQREINNDLLP